MPCPLALASHGLPARHPQPQWPACVPSSSPTHTGFMFTTRMWRSIVCVASGAGIAPVLPVVLQRAAPSIFVLWITSRCGCRGVLRGRAGGAGGCA